MNSLGEMIGDVAVGIGSQSLKRAKRVAEIEATKKYIQGIRIVREAWMTAVFVQLSLLLASICFGTVIGCALYLIPLEPQIKAISLLVLAATGSALFIMSFLYFNSEERWMKFSKATEIVERIVRHK